MNAPPHPVERLQAELPDLEWITDDGRIARLSQDFSWFSPVLKRQLDGKRAQAVAKPRSEDEIKRLVSLCARLRVPITIRGSGTGNYGQSTPLQGGIVLDMTGYNAFLWARDGAARAQAGIRLSELEKATRPLGWELRCAPSTWRTASLGGLFGGGFGGIGSINYGPLAARGNILGLRAITIEDEPQLVELRGSEAVLLHHMWGTNGIVLEIEIGLAPAYDWIEQLVVFDDFDTALDFGDAVSRSTGIVKRELAFLSAPIPDYFKLMSDYLPTGCHAYIVAVAPASEDALKETVAQFGGRITYRKTAEEVRASNRTLLEYTWNHTTLNALKVDKTLTYLQVAFTPGQHLEQVRKMDKLLAPEVMTHTEFIRNIDGHMICTALQLIRFSTEERLQEIMKIYRDNGIRVNDPHVYIVEDGRAQGVLSPGSIAMKKRFDPLGLLNPGKVRTWMSGVPA